MTRLYSTPAAYRNKYGLEPLFIEVHGSTRIPRRQYRLARKRGLSPEDARCWALSFELPWRSGR